MYSEEILDLYSQRPNVGFLEDKTHEGNQDNPTCGDEIHVELKIEKGIIKDIKYTNKKNCFVTILSVSVLTEKIKGMNVEEVKNLTKEDIDKMIGKKIIETRIKCELMPLEAIKKALENE
jgi:nitrogen fixation protein NifU and related proteins